MLPCQNTCLTYTPGCHKTCSRWKAFQERQFLRRQAQKAYLKYYGELCTLLTRQYRGMEPRHSLR